MAVPILRLRLPWVSVADAAQLQIASTFCKLLGLFCHLLSPFHIPLGTWGVSPYHAGMSRPPQAPLRPLCLDFSLRHCNATARCHVGHGFSLRSTLRGAGAPFCPGIPHTGLTYPPPEEMNATDSKNGELWENKKKNMEEKMAKLLI